MNFIELLFALHIEKEPFSRYTDNDIIKVEKRINVERQINTEISTVVTDKLINAIKLYPRELEDFLKKKSLVHLFLNKKNEVDYNDAYGHPRFEAFFKEFIEEDLKHIFKRKITQKEYTSLENVMQFESFFSFDFTDEIQRILQSKLMYASAYFRTKPIRKHAEYDFLIDKHFFSFINHFNNNEIEDAILRLYNKVVDQVNKQQKSKFPLYALMAFSYYKTDDDDLKKTLSDNKAYAKGRLKNWFNFGDSKGKSGSGFRGFAGGFVIFIIVIRVFLIIGRSSNTSRSRSYPKYNLPTEYAAENFSRNYIKKTFDTNEKELIHYLEVDNVDKKYPVRLVKNIKTGDNPFDIKFSEFNMDNYPHFTFLNKTKHDIIVLEFEKFKYGKRAHKRQLLKAIFVRSQDSIQLSNYDDYKNTSFLLYVGDSLANYRNPASKDIVTQVYKKNKRIPESRFLHNINGTKRFLNTFFKFKERTIITGVYENSKKPNLFVNSKGMQQSNGSKYFTEKNAHVIYLTNGPQSKLISK